MKEKFKGYKNHEGYADFTAYPALKNIEKEKKNVIEKILKGDIFVITRPDEEPGDPAVVVSSDDTNQKSPFVTIIYLKEYKDRTENDIDIVARTIKTARCEAIHRVHKSKLGEYIRQCNQSEIDSINQAISNALDLRHCCVESADPEEIYILKEENKKLNNEMHRVKSAFAKCIDENEEIKKNKNEVEQLIVLLQDRLKNENQGDKEIIVMKTERDLYKKLYEETMDKLLGAKA